MDRYRPLKTNATGVPVIVIDADAQTSELLENALLRIRAGTGLLEAMMSSSTQHAHEADTYRIFLAAYLPLQDGLDLLEHLCAKK